jgi:hypothetical protein
MKAEAQLQQAEAGHGELACCSVRGKDEVATYKISMIRYKL